MSKTVQSKSEKQLYRDRALKGKRILKELVDEFPQDLKVSEINNYHISYPHTGFSFGIRVSKPMYMFYLKREMDKVHSFEVIDGWVWFLLIY